MSETNENLFGERMKKKACIEADILFHQFYNSNAEEMKTSEQLDTKIKNLMVISYLRGVKACLTKPDEYLSLCDTLKSLIQ